MPPAPTEKGAVVGRFTPSSVANPAPLGPLAATRRPTTKYHLLMAVDAALRAGNPAAMGAVTLDEATMNDRCPKLAPKVATLRAESAQAFADCVAFVDWSRAKRVALEDDMHRGRPPGSCGLGKEGAKLHYRDDDTVVAVKVVAVVVGRHHLALQPLRCRRHHTYDDEGTRVAASADDLVDSWTAEPTHRVCPGLPWPHVLGAAGLVATSTIDRPGADLVPAPYRCPTP